MSDKFRKTLIIGKFEYLNSPEFQLVRLVAICTKVTVFNETLEQICRSLFETFDICHTTFYLLWLLT